MLQSAILLVLLLRSVFAGPLLFTLLIINPSRIYTLSWSWRERESESEFHFHREMRDGKSVVVVVEAA